jgi:hypothetical protein
MGPGGPFLGGKAQPGRDSDHSPPSSAEVKYEQELYLLSPHVPPWHVEGQLYFFFYFMKLFAMVFQRRVTVALFFEKIKEHLRYLTRTSVNEPANKDLFCFF